MSGRRPWGGEQNQLALLHPFRDERHERSAARHTGRKPRHSPMKQDFSDMPLIRQGKQWAFSVLQLKIILYY